MIIKGDLNGDGRITRDDMILAEMYLLELKQSSGEPILDKNALLAADIDSNGKVTLADFARINIHILGQGITNEVIY